MTKDELKKLYDAKIEAERAMEKAHADKSENFESDLVYQTAGVRYGMAAHAYNEAVRTFALEQVAA